MLSFGDSFEELVLVSAHSYLSYIDVTVGNSHHAEVLLLGAFAGSSELCDSCSRGSFRGLTAGVGVNFRIENEDVDVVVRSEDMVNTAVTDIVGPTVTTDDPLATFYEELFLSEEVFENRFAGSFFFEESRQFVSAFTSAFTFISVSSPVAECFLEFRRSDSFSSVEVFDQVFADFVYAEEHAEAKFSSIFEEAVCPGRAVAGSVHGVRGNRSRCTPNGGAACCVSDHHAVAEERCVTSLTYGVSPQPAHAPGRIRGAAVRTENR